MTVSRTLQDWVDYIQTLHAREIDLSLERVRDVFTALYPDGVEFTIVNIAGTNGKGSTAELIASIYRCAGYSVGKYTSPHLVSFNERFQINGQQAVEEPLLEAFERVEMARAEIPLTFFEFGTLLAIDIFAQAKVDIAVMEVGLGGRLDAVNILEPDITVITSIAMDHTAWLGTTIDAIATEKFGITRAQIPCVLGMPTPPEKLLQLAGEKEVPLLRAGVDYQALEVQDQNNGQLGWRYETQDLCFENLPLPYDQAGHQIHNAGAALTVIQTLRSRLAVSDDEIVDGIRAALNPARCEIVQRQPFIVIDVAHNEASVAALTDFLQSLEVSGDIIAVCGMLRDKEISAALAQIAPVIDDWYLASIHDERGSTAAEIAIILEQVSMSAGTINARQFHEVTQAFEAAEKALTKHDCLVVFGSFFISGDIIAHLKSRDDHD